MTVDTTQSHLESSLASIFAVFLTKDRHLVRGLVGVRGQGNRERAGRQNRPFANTQTEIRPYLFDVPFLPVRLYNQRDRRFPRSISGNGPFSPR